MTAALAPEPWVQCLGWALLHFLWQGTLIVILYAALRALLGRSMPPAGRYALACAALGAMAAAPPLTFLFLLLSDGRGTPAAWAVPEFGWREILPGVVAAWMLGAALLSLRLAMGWSYTRRLCAAAHPAPAEWQRLVRLTAARVGATRPVRLLVSSLVEVPVVIGWLRPAILVPFTSLTALPIEQLSAVLAHELAHIRRNDYLAAILQNLAEALLFYHPAVWWVSRQIRIEREFCCDDLVVHAGADVLAYARALAQLESCRPARLHPAQAAAGMPLLERVRRLLDPPGYEPARFPGAAAWAMTLLWLLGAGAAAASVAPAGQEPLQAASHDVPYDPFLPAPQALFGRYGVPHTALPNGPDLLRPVPGNLNNKYGTARNVLRGGTVRIRQDAIAAPLPAWPPSLSHARRHGLVVVEVVVSPNGNVRESLILATFHQAASSAVSAALAEWRFHSIDQLAALFADWKPCGDCLRIGRLGFEFRDSPGEPRVVDLAAAQIHSKRLVSPFLKKPRSNRPGRPVHR